MTLLDIFSPRDVTISSNISKHFSKLFIASQLLELWNCLKKNNNICTPHGAVITETLVIIDLHAAVVENRSVLNIWQNRDRDIYTPCLSENLV